jgi:hypothetical protein
MQMIIISLCRNLRHSHLWKVDGVERERRCVGQVKSSQHRSTRMPASSEKS